ncbi:hypothetical protein HK099_006065 [Clydaea vesicula]|uniref:Uncharacterized protein n=1 Tax=Clydaea vesicula TaxID=447962 RepID=A0AAD5U6D5_9FUNG|nr:hypothetical protein HK099_006065 [Clydaea vesicula]
MKNIKLNFDMKILKQLDQHKIHISNKNSNTSLLDLANHLDQLIKEEFNISTVNFLVDYFKLGDEQFSGPLWHLNEYVITLLKNYVKDFEDEDFTNQLFFLCKEFMERQKKGYKISQYIDTTIGHQILIQLVANSFNGIFTLKNKKNKQNVLERLANFYSSQKLPEAVGHALIWILEQPRLIFAVSHSQKRVFHHPDLVEFCFEHMLTLLFPKSEKNSNAPKKKNLNSFQSNSLDFINQLLNEFNEFYILFQSLQKTETNSIFRKPQISINSFLYLLDVLKQTKSNFCNSTIENALIVDIYTTLRKCILEIQSIEINNSKEQFLKILNTFSNERDIWIRNELKAFIAGLFTLEYYKIQGNEQYEVWLMHLNAHPLETQEILDYLLQEAKKNSVTWKKNVSLVCYENKSDDYNRILRVTTVLFNTKIEYKDILNFVFPFFIAIKKEDQQKAFNFQIFLEVSCNDSDSCDTTEFCSLDDIAAEPIPCLWKSEFYLKNEEYFHHALPTLQYNFNNFKNNLVQTFNKNFNQFDKKVGINSHKYIKNANSTLHKQILPQYYIIKKDILKFYNHNAYPAFEFVRNSWIYRELFNMVEELDSHLHKFAKVIHK